MGRPQFVLAAGAEHEHDHRRARAEDRLHTTLDWLDSWHSFSFGHHYDPANVNHGLLIVHNDDTVAPGRGFGMHSHRDMEIVTWVLEGELRHRDSEGNDAVIYPGLAQRMSAGTGITHSEWNASEVEPVHFLQMWVPPDVTGAPAGYQEADVTRRARRGRAGADRRRRRRRRAAHQPGRRGALDRPGARRAAC